MEIQFNSEKVHTQQTKRNMRSVILNLKEMYLNFSFARVCVRVCARALASA